MQEEIFVNRTILLSEENFALILLYLRFLIIVFTIGDTWRYMAPKMYASFNVFKIAKFTKLKDSYYA